MKSAMKTKSDKVKLYWMWAFLLTELILIIAYGFAEILPGQKWLFLDGDLLSQYALCCKLFWTKLFHGEYLYYSFQTGFGMNDSLLYSFMALNPFNVFYAIIPDLNIAGIVSYSLKIGFSAICFQKYCGYNLHFSGKMSILFSTAYALMSYGLEMKNMNSLYDAVYFVPLIFILIKYSIDKKRLAYLGLAYGFLFLTNFYGGYLVGLFTFGYFCYYLFGKEKKNIRESVSYIFRYVCSVCIGFMLSAFWLMPTVYQALRQNVIDSEFTFDGYSFWNLFAGLFPGYQMSLYRDVPFLYCGIIVLYLVPNYFLDKKNNKKEKLFFAIVYLFFVACMYWKPLYMFMHMFNDPTGYTYRFVYLVTFLNMTLAVKQWARNQFNTRMSIWVWGFLLIVLYLVAPFFNTFWGTTLFVCKMSSYGITLLFIMTWVICLFLTNKICKKRNDNAVYQKPLFLYSVLLIVVLELIFNTTKVLEGRETLASEYKNFVSNAEKSVSYIKGMDNDVYRIRNRDAITPNQSMAYDYYGASVFTSSNYVELKEFLNAIGLNCSGYIISEYGETDLSRLLLNTRYSISANVDGTHEKEVTDYSDQTAGMSFFVDKRLSEYTVSSNNVFENQNQILGILGADDNALFTMVPYQDIQIDTEGATVDYTEDYIHIIVNHDALNATVTIKIPHVEGKQSYAWVTRGENAMYGDSPSIYSGELERTRFGRPFVSTPFIIRLAQEGEYDTVKIDFAEDNSRELFLTDFYFAYYDNDITEVCNILKEQDIRIVSWEDGHIVENVNNLSENQILYFSIPYEEGWTATVDGEDTVILPLFDGALIGLEVPLGEHQIELRFQAPLSNGGIWISSLGLILFLAFAASERFFMNNKNNVMKQN